MDVFLMSFKGTHPGWQGVVNRGIRALDKTRYSHSVVGVRQLGGVWIVISATGVDGGVTMKQLPTPPDLAVWDLVPMPWVNGESVLSWGREHQGEPYDFMGVARFAVPWMLREHPSRWFCSEASGAAIGLPEAWRFTPATLHAAVSGMLIEWNLSARVAA